MKCFEQCKDLINITIPLNETRVVYGNKIFNNQSHFNQSIYLPKYIEIINGNEVETTSLEIPSFVTSLDDNCFNGFNRNIKEIHIPETVKIIPMECFNILKVSNCFRI